MCKIYSRNVCVLELQTKGIIITILVPTVHTMYRIVELIRKLIRSALTENITCYQWLATNDSSTTRLSVYGYS